MVGKHTSQGQTIRQLEETIRLKDKEIHDIKYSVADVLRLIRELIESNDCGDPSAIKRRISELCTDTRYELLIDEIEEEQQKGKLIELTKAQINR